MRDASFLSKIVKGAGILFAGIILSKLLTYAFRAVVAKYFGASYYGLLVLALAIVSFIASILVMGLPQGLLRFISYYLGKGRRNLIAPLIGSVVKFVLPASLAFAFLVFFFSDSISNVIFHKPDLVPFLQIFAFLTPVLVLYNVFDNVLQAFQDAKGLVLSRSLADPLARISLLLLFMILGFGMLGAAFAYLIGMSFAVMIMILLVKRRIHGFSRVIFRPARLSKEVLHYSLPLLFNNFAFLILGWADVIILGIFVANASIGVYDAASVTSRLLSIVTLAFGTMFMPAITEVYAKDNLHVAKLYNHVGRWVVILILPAALLLGVFSRSMLSIFFGSEFGAGGASLMVLLIGQFLWGWGLLSSNVLAMMKRTKLIFFNSAIGAVMNVVLNFMFIPKWGILGAAIATAISLSLMALLNVFGAYRFTGAWPFDRSFFKMLVGLAVPYAGLYAVYGRLMVDTSLMGVIAIGSAFFLVYALVLLILGVFDKEDMVVFRSMLAKVRSGLK